MKAALSDFKDIAADIINQTMLSVDPAGPEPGQVPLQRLRLARAFKGMPQAVLDACLHLPKHGTVGFLQMQVLSPGHIGEGEERKPFINHLCSSWPHQPQEAAIPVVKIRMMLRLLAEDGWVLVATRGSHRQFEHPVKNGRVTVAGKDSDDLAQGTYNPILKQAKLTGP